MTLGELLAMGHYASYVWTAYGLTLFVFGINLRNAFREKKLIKKILTRHYES